MHATEVKNVFLSASVPLLDRHQKYKDTADVIAIRDSVIALTTVVLPKHRLIWGGHPSITPLIHYVMQRRNLNIQDHMMLYQSLFFEKDFLADINQFKNVIFTEAKKTIPESVTHMRNKMFTDNPFHAAIFVGGMEGVEDEYEMFAKIHPDALLLPIASTGAAAEIIYENMLPEQHKNTKLKSDYGYMSLFQELLLDKL